MWEVLFFCLAVLLTIILTFPKANPVRRVIVSTPKLLSNFVNSKTKTKKEFKSESQRWANTTHGHSHNGHPCHGHGHQVEKLTIPYDK